jgi:hypothetical protein
MSTSLATSPTKPKFRCDGTLDIECASWDRFVVGCIYEPSSSFTSHDPDDYIDNLIARKGHYWAHAGGVYDLLFVAERLRARGIRYHADLSQHRVTRLVVGGLTLRDSYSLMPFPLEEVAVIAGLKAPELPWSCICRRDCGGYCRIAQKAAEGDPDLEAYCMEDCRVLYRSLHALAAHALAHGIDLRGTLGSTAWATAKRELELPDADMPWELWRRIRRSDKGGRLLIGRPVARGPGAHFDIVNAYPGALAHASIPIGRAREVGERRARALLRMDKPGIYTATVTVPDNSFVPPLPWRHGGRVHYPTGSFSGSWPLPELLAAIARGTRVDAVHSAIVWDAEAHLFGELMARWYAIRRKVGKDTPLGAWQSRLAKALTGKFAELPHRERITVHPKTIKICPRTGRCRNGCSKRCGAMDQLDLFGMVWAAPYFKLAPSGHSHWSAYLRAHTRIQWLEAAERYRPGELCYGDTDSLWSTGNTTPQPISDMLGAWEMKHAWTELEIRAPKIYRFTDGEGRRIFRGAPGMTEADWRRGKGIADRGVMTFRQAAHGAKGQLFRRRSRHWSIPSRESRPLWYGDRKLDPLSGITYPPTSDEIRKKAQESK